MSDIEARVKKIIAEQLGVEESQVTNEKSFVADLGADSLDTVEPTRKPERRPAPDSSDQQKVFTHEPSSRCRDRPGVCQSRG